MKERRFLDLMDEVEKGHLNTLSEREKIKYNKMMSRYKKRAERELETLNDRTTATLSDIKTSDSAQRCRTFEEQ